MTFEHIGFFIRSYRQANGESLQSLGDRSGVSRSMISQIESGQTSPTIVVLAKLAEAMNVKLGDLVEQRKIFASVQIAEPNKSNIVSAKNSPFVCHQLLTKSGRETTDFYRFYFKSYGKTAFSTNVVNSIKYLWLEEGRLTIYLSGEKIVLEKGQMTTFNASIPHRFESWAGELAKGIFLVTYQDIGA
jgi:XRE family transcriptional regulator, regulator of sulfur utilization